MRTEQKIFFRPVLFISSLCACPMRKISLATSEKREWKSGFREDRPQYIFKSRVIELQTSFRLLQFFAGTLKATFHLTISVREQRATSKIQRNNYHQGSRGPFLTGKTMSVFLIFTQGTHRNVKNCWVRSSLKKVEINFSTENFFSDENSVNDRRKVWMEIKLNGNQAQRKQNAEVSLVFLKGQFNWRLSQLERQKIRFKFNFSLQSTRWNVVAYVCSAKLHNIEWSRIAIGKMFTNLSFTKNEAVINGETVQICCCISQPRFGMSKNPGWDLVYQKIHPLRNAEFGADCWTPFRILKIIIVVFKNGFGNAIKNCYML